MTDEAVNYEELFDIILWRLYYALHEDTGAVAQAIVPEELLQEVEEKLMRLQWLDK